MHIAHSEFICLLMKTGQPFNVETLTKQHAVNEYIYSSPPLTRTPKGNEKLFELAGVRVNPSWCQISCKLYSN